MVLIIKIILLFVCNELKLSYLFEGRVLHMILAIEMVLEAPPIMLWMMYQIFLPKVFDMSISESYFPFIFVVLYVFVL